MAKVSLLPHPVIKRDLQIRPVVPRLPDDRPEIRVHDPAFVRIRDIIEGSPLVHAERHRTVLDLIPEGQLHLVAVAFGHRTLENPLKPGIRRGVRCAQEPADLFFLQRQLIPLREIQIKAAAAGPEMRALRPDFIRRVLQNLQKAAFRPAAVLFRDARADLLSRDGVFHRHFRLILMEHAFVRETERLHNALNDVTFSHAAYCSSSNSSAMSGSSRYSSSSSSSSLG